MPDGRTEALPPLPLEMSFAWRGWAFAARFAAADGQAQVRLTADLGPLPFTIEDAARRRRLIGLRRRAGIGGVGRFLLGRDGRLLHRIEAGLDMPQNGPALVTALVKLLLAGRPSYEAAGAPARRLSPAAPAARRPGRERSGPDRRSGPGWR